MIIDQSLDEIFYLFSLGAGKRLLLCLCMYILLFLHRTIGAAAPWHGMYALFYKLRTREVAEIVNSSYFCTSLSNLFVQGRYMGIFLYSALVGDLYKFRPGDEGGHRLYCVQLACEAGLPRMYSCPCCRFPQARR